MLSVVLVNSEVEQAGQVNSWSATQAIGIAESCAGDIISKVVMPDIAVPGGLLHPESGVVRCT